MIYACFSQGMRIKGEGRYVQANGADIYRMLEEMCYVNQEERDIAKYFNKVKSLWDEMSDLNDVSIFWSALVLLRKCSRRKRIISLI